MCVCVWKETWGSNGVASCMRARQLTQAEKHLPVPYRHSLPSGGSCKRVWRSRPSPQCGSSCLNMKNISSKIIQPRFQFCYLHNRILTTLNRIQQHCEKRLDWQNSYSQTTGQTQFGHKVTSWLNHLNYLWQSCGQCYFTLFHRMLKSRRLPYW